MFDTAVVDAVDELNTKSIDSHRTCGEIVAIDDDFLTVRYLEKFLSQNKYSVRVSTNGADGLQLINENTAIVLVDLRMPGLSGMDCLRFIREHFPSIQVIILTSSSEVADAVEAMREGAFQFVTKPFDPDQLLVYIDKGFEARESARCYRDLKESHSQSIPVHVAGGASDYHGRLMKQISRIAGLDSTVFIGGESGTGKSTVARLIHQKSNRANGPFVTVNCASLPRDLIQSELFGHTRGAFTGAVKDRIGHAEFADGGTLFLDEIGDLPLELQPKLLTFLQDRTIQRLGNSETKKLDVRLIVATHRDLATMCREHSFRQDLFYRLMVLSLELLPLRHRLDEMPSLAQGILNSLCQRMELSHRRLSPDACDLLLKHEWPGNIRELENVLERALAFSNSQEISSCDLLFPKSLSDSGCGNSLVTNVRPGEPTRRDSIPTESKRQEDSHLVNLPPTFSPKTLEEIERDAIVLTLEACGGNKAKTARVLGISEKSVYNKMHRLNIEG